VASTFVRFALPVNWDFCETNTIGTTAGSYENQIDRIAMVILRVASSISQEFSAEPNCLEASATNIQGTPDEDAGAHIG
jgi:hypothetical protein